MVEISIVVCCYNSAKVIKSTLKHLAYQFTDNGLFNYEVVLVDNNCGDNTVNIAKTVWEEFSTNVNLSIIKEKKAGLSFAREAGVKNSKGEIIIFCDDDNWLSRDYLQIAYNFMIINPCVGVLGGQCKGVLSGNKPIWWEKEKKNYAVGKQSENSGDITERGYVWGAGMIFRKQLFRKLYNSGFKSLLLDRRLDVLTSGGDSELCKWFILMGYKIWYLNSLKLKHYIPNSRLEQGYLTRLKEGHKEGFKTLALYNWFIKKSILINPHNNINTRFTFFKRAIEKKRKSCYKWKWYLQMAIGNRFVIEKDLYRIYKTYKELT